MRRVPALSLLPGDACLAPRPGTPMAPRLFDDPVLVRRLLDARIEVALALAGAWQLFQLGWILVAWTARLTSLLESMNVQLSWPTRATLWSSEVVTGYPFLVGVPLAAAAVLVSLVLPWRRLQGIWSEKDPERAERSRLRLLLFLAALNAGLAVAGYVIERSMYTPLINLISNVN